MLSATCDEACADCSVVALSSSDAAASVSLLPLTFLTVAAMLWRISTMASESLPSSLFAVTSFGRSRRSLPAMRCISFIMTLSGCMTRFTIKRIASEMSTRITREIPVMIFSALPTGANSSSWSATVASPQPDALIGV